MDVARPPPIPIDENFRRVWTSETYRVLDLKDEISIGRFYWALRDVASIAGYHVSAKSIESGVQQKTYLISSDAIFQSRKKSKELNHAKILLQFDRKIHTSLCTS